jgi:ATP-dependent helicase/nuclease subunit A
MTTEPSLQSLLLAEAEEKQRRAANPAVSAWVRANAGTGKTHVLVQRFLRLLLTGAEPRSILCLTFTKNAAAEMEGRILEKLGEWATASEADLARHLSKVLARAPDSHEMALARCLFAAVTDAPGGLAIMTIHGFCERVLRRYSLEANVPPGFTVMTEEEARDALSEASASAFASSADSGSGSEADPLTQPSPQGERAFRAPPSPQGERAFRAPPSSQGERDFRTQPSSLGERDFRTQPSAQEEWAFGRTPLPSGGGFQGAPLSPRAEGIRASPLPGGERDRVRGDLAPAQKGSAIGEALNVAVAHANEAEFARAVQAMLAKRHSIAALLSATSEEDPFPAIEMRLRRLFGLSQSDTKSSLTGKAASLIGGGTLRDAIALLRTGSKTDGDGAARFEAVLRAPDAEAAFEALKAAFLTKTGEPRKALMTSSLKKRAEALYEELLRAQQAFVSLGCKLAGLKLTLASMALLRLTAAIFERYEHAKRTRGALDFDDLIARTLSLLSREEAAQWVLYELDARIGHILVDEAQDTSPEQWAIIGTLTADFFSGEGAREQPPTLFAVGDEKQSIYGFQGAMPELLAYSGAVYEKTVTAAGYEWCAASLDLSFRTLGPVLAAVDGVCRLLPDLQDGEAIRHLAYRGEPGGLVELWAPERGEPEEKGTVWETDEAEAPAPKPSHTLAERIAGQIKHWIETREVLASKGRAIEPGDILILLRKREPMARLIHSALKRHGIPVAGADRMALLDEIAIQDLLALADVLLQPEDDLALAALLRSPLFGLSEDELFRLAYGREGSLWQSVQESEEFELAAKRLAGWRDLAHRSDPFDFYAHILYAEEGRTAFAARLGQECFDALDEFLTLAETFGARPQGDLAEFAAFVRKSASEVKRDADQTAREVRIMTVHGAKGLEANIVILADTCGAKSASPAPIYSIDGDGTLPPIPVWAIKGTGGLEAVSTAKEAIKAADRRELGRLLYVAMTRARDRLYIAGFHNRTLPEGCWYETIQAALAPVLHEAQDFAGRPVWRMGAHDPIHAGAANRIDGIAEPPAWCMAPIVSEDGPLILSPSKLAEALGADRPAPARESGVEREIAQLRGTLIHRLLEVLPALPPASWRKAAEAISASFASSLDSRDRAGAIATAMALLSGEHLRGVWQTGFAEAGLAVSEQGKIILGQADRIVLKDNRIAIVDYKSGAAEPASEPRPAHLAQLACYRLALQRIYPGTDVSAALLHTRSAKIIEAGKAALDTTLADILTSE